MALACGLQSLREPRETAAAAPDEIPASMPSSRAPASRHTARCPVAAQSAELRESQILHVKLLPAHKSPNS
jgi:hypothetical protein